MGRLLRSIRRASVEKDGHGAEMEHFLWALGTASLVTLVAWVMKRGNPFVWGLLSVLAVMVCIPLFRLMTYVQDQHWDEKGMNSTLILGLASFTAAGIVLLAMSATKRKRGRKKNGNRRREASDYQLINPPASPRAGTSARSQSVIVCTPAPVSEPTETPPPRLPLAERRADPSAAEPQTDTDEAPPAAVTSAHRPQSPTPLAPVAKPTPPWMEAVQDAVNMLDGIGVRELRNLDDRDLTTLVEMQERIAEVLQMHHVTRNRSVSLTARRHRS